MDLDAIAGVSLKPPQASYELTVADFGRIVLTRPPRWNLSDATLRIERVAEPDDPSPTPVVFSVGPWIPQDARGARDTENLEGERELLVEHALLSHPELVTAAETASSDGLSVASMTSLDRLRKRWSNIVEASRDLYRWSPITCEECLRNRRVSDGRFAGRGMYSSSGREPCPHTTVGSQALRALCEAHGELVFELVQWLVPSTVVQSFGEVILPPRRFVLHHELMTALVAQWLLGMDLVTVATAFPQPGDVPVGNEVGDDGLRGALGDPDTGRDVTTAHVRFLRNADEHVGVVRQECPS